MRVMVQGRESGTCLHRRSQQQLVLLILTGEFAASALSVHTKKTILQGDLARSCTSMYL